jgi:hypothetical protein
MPRTLARPRAPPGMLSGAWQTEVSHSTYPLEHGRAFCRAPCLTCYGTSPFLILTYSEN